MDYVDGELDEAAQGRVKSHLNTCQQCKRLEEELRHLAIEPLNNAKKAEAPEKIWHNIRNSIEGQRVTSLSDLIGGWLVSLRARTPVIAFATAAAVILMAVSIMRFSYIGKSEMGTYLKEGSDFMSSLAVNNDEEASSDIETANLNTTIEKYLL